MTVTAAQKLKLMTSNMSIKEKQKKYWIVGSAIIVFFCWSLQAALKQLATNKVPNMAVLLKSIVHTHADARAVFKDPTGFRLTLTPTF